MLCREWSLVNRRGQVTTILPLLCKCWHCPVCAPVRRRWLKADALDGHPNTFLTLTHRPRPGQSHDEAACEMVRAFRQVRKEAIAKFGLKEFAFLAVFERHESGHPHLHILARVRWVDQKWLSRRWQDLTGSWNVNIQRIRSTAKAVKYCAKYCSKACTPYNGCKRYWRSLDYLDRPKADADGERAPRDTWEIVKVHWWALMQEYGGLGYWIDLHPDHAEVGLGPP